MADYNSSFTGEQIDEAVGKVVNENLPAGAVKFTDGDSFQDKYDAGELTGPQGAQGAQGAPGPNEVSESTATALSGLLKGDGTKVTTAAAGTDYATPDMAIQEVADSYTDFDTMQTPGMYRLNSSIYMHAPFSNGSETSYLLEVYEYGGRIYQRADDPATSTRSAVRYLTTDAAWSSWEISVSTNAGILDDGSLLKLNKQSNVYPKIEQAVAGTDYVTPEQLSGKLDKTGGTVSGALTVSGTLTVSTGTLYANGGIGLPNKNVILKTTAGGLTTGAVSGTDYTPGTPTSTTIKLTFSNGDTVNLKAYKFGRLVMFPESVWVDKGNVTEGKVGTIPTGYRPTANFTLCPPSNLGYGGYIQFRTNGDIYIGQLMGGVRFAGFICNINYVVP